MSDSNLSMEVTANRDESALDNITQVPTEANELVDQPITIINNEAEITSQNEIEEIVAEVSGTPDVPNQSPSTPFIDETPNSVPSDLADAIENVQETIPTSSEDDKQIVSEIDEPKQLSNSITVAAVPEVGDREQRAKIEEFINQKPVSEDLKDLSDDDIIIDGILSDSDSSESDSCMESDSDSDSDSGSEIESKIVPNADVEDSDEEGETISGPIISRNEVLDEVAPSLPKDYKIPENAPIEPIGTITALVENSMVIKANISGEFRVLKDQSVFCFEDRSVIGPLFETFGRLQNPVYRVKFNSVEEFDNFKETKGKTVYYVVPDSTFIYTDSIKNLKGTDASNCHDEELPEEEQEFSDDEKELEMKQSKKKNKKNKKKGGEEGASKEANRKRQNEPRSETDPKRFQPYGYAQPQPHQVTNQQYHQHNIPAYTPISQNNSPHVGPHQSQQIYNNPQLTHQQFGYQSQASPQASPYGVPFSQAQAQLAQNNHHQVYNQMQQPQAYSNSNLPPYPGQIHNYANQNLAPVNGYNHWNQLNCQGQQPHTIQAVPGQQQYIPNQFQQSQLQQLQQLLVNQLQQQNSRQPPNQPYQQPPPQ